MSDGDQALNVIYLVGILVLTGSAFLVRRVPIGQTGKMVAAWLLIFAALFVGFATRDDLAALGRRVIAEAGGSGETSRDGRQIRVHQSDDGHFWINGRVNGVAVRFLVDSGATFTSLSAGTARSAGIVATDSIPAVVQTANGIVRVQRAEAGSIAVGPIVRRDMAVHVSEAFGDTNVLGMNFLSSLRGWSVEGAWLVLRS